MATNPDFNGVRAIGGASVEERIENARSIEAIPAAQFPDWEARGELVWRALRGEDVYAYRPMGRDEYVVWVRLDDPAAAARFAPMEWAARWRAAGMPSSREEAALAMGGIA